MVAVHTVRERDLHDSCCLVTKSCLTLVTPWTLACQVPWCMGFPRQGYWGGLPFPSPGDLHPGIEPAHLLCCQVNSFPLAKHHLSVLLHVGLIGGKLKRFYFPFERHSDFASLQRIWDLDGISVSALGVGRILGNKQLTPVWKRQLNLSNTESWDEVALDEHRLAYLFSCSVVSSCLPTCGLQHTRLVCPSLSPRYCSNSCPLSQQHYVTISMHSYMLSRFGRVWLFVTLWSVACQAPLSVGFSRQEYWSGLPCPPPEDLPHTGIEPESLMSPVLADGFFTTTTEV